MLFLLFMQPQLQSLSMLNLLMLQHLPQLMPQPLLQHTDLPQFMVNLSQSLPLLMTLDMESREMNTMDLLSMLTMKTAMDTTQLENTVLLFLMAAPRLSHTVLTMLSLAMLLMSDMRVLLSHMKLPSQPMLQPLHQLMPQLPRCLMSL